MIGNMEQESPALAISGVRTHMSSNYVPTSGRVICTTLCSSHRSKPTRVQIEVSITGSP
jgi:hypothetical protein